MPRPENIRALASLLRVPLDWLYGEEGDAGERRVREKREPWQASAVDRHAVDAFLALEERHRKLVRELIAALAETAKH